MLGADGSITKTQLLCPKLDENISTEEGSRCSTFRLVPVNQGGKLGATTTRVPPTFQIFPPSRPTLSPSTPANTQNPFSPAESPPRPTKQLENNPANFEKQVGGGGATVTVVDRCPACKQYDLDLSEAAYNVLGDQDAGWILIEWQWLT